MWSGEGSTNQGLHCLYRSPDIVRVTKFRRLRWTDHVASMEEDSSAFRIVTGVIVKHNLLL